MGRMVKRVIGATVALALVAPAVQAHGRYDGPGQIEWQGHYDGRHDHGDGPGDHHGPGWRPGPEPHGGPVYYRAGPPPWVRTLPPDHWRVYRDVVVVRPYGHWYHGYGHYHDDDAALAFLGLSAITFLVLDSLNEAQQRAHEEAQIRATTAPVGQAIVWSDGGASGNVVATREGHTANGLYCREFQQSVTIGGRNEQAYGTACRQPDGSWQVVSE